jgi:superfamily I DNA/RNA helicase
LDERNWGGWLLDRLDSAQLSPKAVRLLETVGTAVDPREGIHGFLANLEPLGKDIAANTTDAVRIMTMGQSKGLTVNTTIVLGVEEGIVPLTRPEVDPVEERRLLYVATTRATDVCLLTYAARRTGPSARFGASNVYASRSRSPLLASLPGEIGRPQNGPACVAALKAEAASQISPTPARSQT